MQSVGAEIQNKTKLSSMFGLFVFLLSFAVFLFVLGYIYFCISVTRAQSANVLPHADGIVVLTGGGGGRLEAAGMVMSDGKAERLFVSGVASVVTPEDIRKILGLNEAQFSCCVDLDSAAKDTIGNARETAIWAQALGYEHIILVTSDYHMPRAKLEITSATGGLRLTPYSVSTRTGLPIWKDGNRIVILAREYLKLLVIYMSRMGDRPNLPPQPEPAPIDSMREAKDMTKPDSELLPPTP